MSIDVVTLTLAKAYADEVAATGGGPGKLEEIVQNKVDQALGELGSIGGADWSVNDETNPAFIKNRTHYDAGGIIIPANAVDGTEVYWEGPTGNEVQGQDYFMAINDAEAGLTAYAYKVSNKPIPFDQLDNIKLKEILVHTIMTSTEDATEVDKIINGEEAFGSQAVVATQEFVVGQIKGYIIDDIPAIISVIQDTDLSFLGQTGIATVGTYFLYVPQDGGAVFLTHLNHSTVKQLDLKYIPDIAFGTLEMSKVGTTATIKYIDRNNNIQTINISDGYIPVRGTDYWTEADKAEIKSYVDNAILGGSW